MKVRCAYDKLVPLKELRPHPKNPNDHPDDQIIRLAQILEYQGVRIPIVVSLLSGYVTRGHGRMAAAKLNGWTEVPVNYQEYESPDQEYADLVADNAIALWAELNMKAINSVVGELGPDLDINLLGIENFTIDISEKMTGDEDAVPELDVATRAKPGDLFLLDRHRVLCGDSCSAEDLARLMEDALVDLVFTDPPYGVDYDGGTTKREKLSGDTDTDLYAPTCRWAYEYSHPDAAMYLWHASTRALDVIGAIKHAGWEMRSQIIWNKNIAQFGALTAQYKQKHEPAFYCYKKGEVVNWIGPTNEVSVWDMERSSKNEFHPTQKPVELAERAISNHRVVRVLDLFLGSGSTLVACEKTSKICYGMEISPGYVDVIIDRWQNLTKKQAVRGDGTPWQDLEKR